ncbi:MAG: hypothetical protein HY800_09395, partial [Ignavibacteriales bacterium]|nr:hypothetical protein [Ignavibacteriales bacterium]
MKFGIIGNIRKPAIKEVTEDLLGFLTLKKIPFVVHEELGKWFNNSGAGL